MASNRDDFSIAFRSALLQRGAAQKFSLFFLLLLAIFIFFLDTYGFSFMKPVRAVINDGIYRVSLVASSPSRFFPQATKGITNLINIKNENVKLKNELEVYKQNELKVEFLTDQSLFTENIIVAKVLIDKSSPYLKSIIINRGSHSGVLKGMPVLDKDYLIGRVVETNYLSSRVLLLSDLNSRIPVTFGEDGIQAILKGNGSSKPVLEYLPKDYVVKEGLEIFTSGKDRIFFAGSPIGRTNDKGEVILFSESSQLSFVKINKCTNNKEAF